MDEDETHKPRGADRSPSEQMAIKSSGRRPGEKIPSSKQPKEKRHRGSHDSTPEDRASASSRGSSRASSSSSKGEPRPSTSKEVTPVSEGGSSGRSRGGDDTSRQRRNRYEIIQTRPTTVTSKSGKSGDQIQLQTNYFKLLTRPTWNIYKYHVSFSPEIESIPIRRGVLSEKKSVLGGYLFDGAQLYTTTKLVNDKTEFEVKSKTDTLYKIVVKFINNVSMTEWQSLQILNLILRRAMEGLKLQLVGRNFFDPAAKIDIREYKLQLWPGYQTSIRQHEKDILLCAEIAHKVMRTETVYDILQRCMRESRDYKEEFKRQILGTTVLTDYNNKTYRVDDIDFTDNPTKTFSMKGKETSFIDYYYERYHIRIRDRNQPLLVTVSKERERRGGQKELLILIPELCRATGLSESMRSNFQLGRAMSEYTRMNPDRRLERLAAFNKRLQQTEASMRILQDWNMKLSPSVVEFTGRVLKPENIVFYGNKVSAGENCDWTRYFRDNKMFTSVELRNWVLICPNRNHREAREMVECIIRAAQGMRMTIRQPEQCPIYDDRTNSYTNAIESCARNDPQLVMIVVPNINAERYGAIKKKACVDRAIPTQVVVQKTCCPKKGGLMSVATKIAIQINCKLGAVPWMIELPLSGLMTIGYDLCKSTRDKSKAYGALVATMDLKQEAKYYTTVAECHASDTLSNNLTISVVKALREYRKVHGTLPNRILFYRDGVGDGQVNQVVQHEVKSLVEELDSIYKKANNPNGVRFAFIIVSKRINTRIFNRGRNPPPGTVVDDVITLPEKYDFYLVSQSVRQGTVSPTDYNVVYDSMGLDPDRMQILTYKQTHLYYNWSGTTRVPAVCQYAKKLSTLVAQSIHQIPSTALEKQLYFL